jgi:hypothetical protein
LKIQKCDLLKATFILRNGSYEYTMMSFGLTKSPTYRMDLMSKVFMEYLDKLVIVLINELLVCTKDEEEHQEHLCLVL